MSVNASNAKKRRLDYDKPNHAVNSTNSSPIVYINVGGANRNIRRSLLTKLRQVSHDNPLCILLLRGANHWSDVPTTTDQDGTNTVRRIYVDRNPDAFDDLLEYVEYGVEFLENIIKNDDDEARYRLRKLGLECDYFTVDSLAADVDEVTRRMDDDVDFGEPVSFRTDGWFSMAGQRCRGGFNGGWRWNNISGNNQSIASQNTFDTDFGDCVVETTATYLLIFSLHTIATTALSPNRGYTHEDDDEFSRIVVYPDVMTRCDSDFSCYTIARCGAFDYRSDEETRMNDPLLYTASFVELISLRKGNRLGSKHGTGIVKSGRGPPIGAVVTSRSEFPDEPECVHFMKLIRVFGDNMEKWNVKREEGEYHNIAEPTKVKWMVCRNDWTNPNSKVPRCAHLDDEDNTTIRFQKAGYYLLVGRVAGRLKKNYSYANAAIKLELRTNGGTPLHISHKLISYPGVSFPGDQDDVPYDKRRVDYSPINDVIYAERESCLRVVATGGACIAQHGTVPDSFDKIPTQSLSAMRLASLARVDRYQVSLVDASVKFERALGKDESASEPESLFRVIHEGAILQALVDCQCILVGSLAYNVAEIASLRLNGNPILHSQLCKESGYGSHNISTIIQIEREDSLQISLIRFLADSGNNMGHLAFVALE